VADQGQPLLDALHRIYVGSLPDELYDKVRDRIRPAAREMDLYEALHTVANSELDELEKWHLALAFDSRRHDLVEADDRIARGVAELVVRGEDDRVDRAIDQLRHRERSEEGV
jgi:hypothetical protein